MSPAAGRASCESGSPLLAAAEAAGVVVWLDQAKVRLRADAEPPAALLDELRAHKAELIVALRSAEPPWEDDREWIARWCHAGTTLAEREPVLRAWLATMPPGPLPRVLPAVELARIARQYGGTVEIEPRHPAIHGEPR